AAARRASDVHGSDVGWPAEPEDYRRPGILYGASSCPSCVADLSWRDGTSITQQLGAYGFRREAQRIAEVEKCIRPRAIARCHPVVRFQVKPLLVASRREAETLQVVRRLAENTHGQNRLG